MCTRLRNQAAEISKEMKETPSVKDMIVGLLNNMLPTWMDNLESMVRIITTFVVSLERVMHLIKLL